MPDHAMRCFSVIPLDESLPSVDLLFDENVEYLIQVGSGGWHCHPSEIEYAIDLARKLVHHEMCVLEEWSDKGEHSGSGPVAPDEVLGTLRLDAGHFVRRFFGKPPVREAIDFSRYAKGKHLYIELNRKADSDAAWRSLGKPPPEF